VIDNLKPDDLFHTLPPQVRREIEKLIGDGRKIEAIKLFRVHTEAGLRESKDAIENWGEVRGFEDLPRETRELLKKLVPGIEKASSFRVVDNRSVPSRSGSERPAGSWHDLPAEARTEIERLLPEGRFVEAVRVYRKHSRSGLKEAKDAVYRAAAGMGLEPPRALASGLTCLFVALGFLVWMGIVAAMPFAAKYFLTSTFGDDISPQLVEAAQAALPIVTVILSVFAVIGIIVRRSRGQ
jgi:ribosomal protein L7/L12